MTASITRVSPVADAIYQRAARRMPGGDSRTQTFLDPHPPYVARGSGCRLTDVDGHVVLDILNNYTALIHGHAHPAIVAEVTAAVADGTAYSLPTEHEVAMAELLAERVSGTDKWRFTNSGTEAVMMAVRGARAFTGRDVLVRFTGSYHGSYDVVVNDKGGIPAGTAENVLQLPFGDGDALVEALASRGDQIAAVLIDPMPNRIGMPQATPGFMRLIREQTRQHGIVMIVDEVISFRLASGGMQSILGVEPDMTVAAKVIGGGFPVGAVGGRAEVMDIFNPANTSRVEHASTFSANPVTMRAGRVAMELMTEAEFARINALGDRLRDGLREQGWTVTGFGSLLNIHLNGSKELWWRLYDGGVLIAPNGLTAISTPMTEAEIDEALDVFARGVPGE